MIILYLFLSLRRGVPFRCSAVPFQWSYPCPDHTYAVFQVLYPPSRGTSSRLRHVSASLFVYGFSARMVGIAADVNLYFRILFQSFGNGEEFACILVRIQFPLSAFKVYGGQVFRETFAYHYFRRFSSTFCSM